MKTRTSSSRDLDDAAPPASTAAADDQARACRLERADWRRCQRRYLGPDTADGEALAVIETWRKR